MLTHARRRWFGAAFLATLLAGLAAVLSPQSATASYDIRPVAPADLTVDHRSAIDPNPAIGSSRPTFRAQVQDASQGDSSTWFDIFRQEDDGAWSFFDNPRQDGLRDGNIATVQASKEMVHGGVYLVRARTNNAYAFGPYTADLIFKVHLVNETPGAPLNLSVDDRPAADPYPAVASVRPAFRARVNDPGPGDSSTWFDIFRQEDDGAWSFFDNPRQDGLRDGNIATVQASKELVHGGVYLVRARTNDTNAFGPFTTDLIFEVDTAGPTVPPVVTSEDYGDDLNQTYGSVGKSGEFTFDANGAPGIVGFDYGWNDPPTSYVATPSGRPVTVALAPRGVDALHQTQGGLRTLYVQSVDGAGRTSPITSYSFKVGSASKPAADWKLDEPAGSETLVDSSGNGHNFSVNGAAAGVPGPLVGGPGASSSAVRFDGVDDFASTDGPVVDTSRDFTVAVWVKPEHNKGGQTMVSAGDGENSAFFLRQNADGWIFTVVDEAGQIAEVNSGVRPELDVWTHVAGSYSYASRSISLTLNGIPAGFTYVYGVVEATGKLELGTDHWQGVSPSHTPFAGDLAGVQVWDRLLTRTEREQIAAPVVADWWMDGDGWDASPFEHEAELFGGVSEAKDRFGSDWFALQFDGSTGYLGTAGQALNTNSSYTITAWVNADEIRDTPQGILGVEFDEESAVFVGLDANGHWTHRVIAPYRPGEVVRVSQSGPAAAGTWVHLAAVYDSLSGEIRLYVDGQSVGSAGFRTPDSSIGRVTIGSGLVAGELAFFGGRIDDVRIYQGVIGPTTIRQILAADR